MSMPRTAVAAGPDRPELSEVDYAFACQLVRNRAGIVLGEDKQYLVKTRVQPLMDRERFGAFHELFGAIRRDVEGALSDAFIDALTTNETFFFRDVHPFDTLRETVLPDLIRAREHTRRLNIWCAASSSGQEPYSLSLLLMEYFPELRNWSVSVMASDISTEMLCRARAGTYSQLEVNRGLPVRMLVKHFQKIGNQWLISEEIRGMVQFRFLNLTKPWPPLPKYDLIFMRNVLIYFDKSCKQEILGRTRGQMQPDGVLYLGGSETTIGLDDKFEPVRHGPTMVYRLRQPSTVSNGIAEHE